VLTARKLNSRHTAWRYKSLLLPPQVVEDHATLRRKQLDDEWHEANTTGCAGWTTS
jgi:hypothetical protein